VPSVSFVVQSFTAPYPRSSAFIRGAASRSFNGERAARRVAVAALVTCALLLLRPGAAPAQQGTTPFKLIVNASNPVASLTKDQAAKLFYKKQRAWPSGDAVVPVDLAEQSPVRKSFSMRVLGKDASAMRGYWQQMIFTGKGVPPLEKGTDAEVLAYVAATPGAIGYVSLGVQLPAGVKAVTLSR